MKALECPPSSDYIPPYSHPAFGDDITSYIIQTGEHIQYVGRPYLDTWWGSKISFVLNYWPHYPELFFIGFLAFLLLIGDPRRIAKYLNRFSC